MFIEKGLDHKEISDYTKLNKETTKRNQTPEGQENGRKSSLCNSDFTEKGTTAIDQTVLAEKDYSLVDTRNQIGINLNHVKGFNHLERTNFI